jgi:hypothetical protein
MQKDLMREIVSFYVGTGFRNKGSEKIKPKNWNKMTKEEKRKAAEQLFTSPRGMCIVSQGLHFRLKAMKAMPERYTEVSNIEDMEMLRECLFNIVVVEPLEMSDGLEHITCKRVGKDCPQIGAFEQNSKETHESTANRKRCRHPEHDEGANSEDIGKLYPSKKECEEPSNCPMNIYDENATPNSGLSGIRTTYVKGLSKVCRGRNVDTYDSSWQSRGLH